MCLGLKLDAACLLCQRVLPVVEKRLLVKRWSSPNSVCNYWWKWMALSSPSPVKDACSCCPLLRLFCVSTAVWMCWGEEHLSWLLQFYCVLSPYSLEVKMWSKPEWQLWVPLLQPWGLDTSTLLTEQAPTIQLQALWPLHPWNSLSCQGGMWCVPESACQPLHCPGLQRRNSSSACSTVFLVPSNSRFFCGFMARCTFSCVIFSCCLWGCSALSAILLLISSPNQLLVVFSSLVSPWLTLPLSGFETISFVSIIFSHQSVSEMILLLGEVHSPFPQQVVQVLCAWRTAVLPLGILKPLSSAVTGVTSVVCVVKVLICEDPCFLVVLGEFLGESDVITQEPARDSFHISIFAVPAAVLRMLVPPGVSKVALFFPVLCMPAECILKRVTPYLSVFSASAQLCGGLQRSRWSTGLRQRIQEDAWLYDEDICVFLVLPVKPVWGW